MQPQTDRRELDESKISWRRACRSGGDTPALLDPVEEPLDQVSCIGKGRAKQIGLAISFWRDVCHAPFCLATSDPVGRDIRDLRAKSLGVGVSPGRAETRRLSCALPGVTGKVCWQTSGVHGRRGLAGRVRLLSHQNAISPEQRGLQARFSERRRAPWGQEKLAKRSGGIARGWRGRGSPSTARERWCWLPEGLRTFMQWFVPLVVVCRATPRGAPESPPE